MPKLPFIAEVPEFKPRKHLGQATNLDPFQKDVLEALDVIDQKGEYSMALGIKAWNGVLIVAGILILALLINLPVGAMAAGVIKGWFLP